MFSDFAAHVLGVPDNAKLPESDSGVNKTYAFRTPSLRNLSVTGSVHAQRRLREPSRRWSTSTSGSAAAEDGEAAVAGAGAEPQVSRDQIDPLARQLNMRGGGRRT